MHVVFIGQSLTARATGAPDSSVRENIGIKVLARYSQRSWLMQAPEWPMPPAPVQLGRVQVVTAAGVRETQAPRVDYERARAYAVSGTVTACPAGMPCAQVPVTDKARIENPPADQPVVIAQGPPVTGPGDAVTLAEAVALGITGPSLAAVRTARGRDAGFPSPAGHRGLANLYDPADLAAWEQARRAVS
ncbi:MAG: hypothetical protein ACLQDY_15305 [Streptosporangiaceae bacterium]